jgi:hypothetical protein
VRWLDDHETESRVIEWRKALDNAQFFCEHLFNQKSTIRGVVSAAVATWRVSRNPERMPDWCGPIVPLEAADYI